MANRTCSIDGCERQHYGKGYCQLHYHRVRRTGSADPPAKARPHRCAIEGCDGLTGVPGTARGWCTMHYQRWQRHGDPLGHPDYINKGKSCSVEGCDKPAVERGWCSKHYTRWQRYGSLEHPEAWARAPEGQKWCPTCERYRPLDEFSVNRTTADGRQGECKFCGRRRIADWRERNPEKAGAWKVANRERANAIQRRSRARRQAEGRVPPSDRRARLRNVTRELFTRLEIAERDGWRCGICRHRIGRSYRWPHPRSLSIDHIVPLAAGGDHTKANVQASHLRCNLSKKARGTDQLRLIG